MSLTEALSWIAEAFEMPAENLKPDTPRDEIELWDSLGALVLMSKLDEEFGIILENDELAEMKSVADILKIFQLHGQLE